MTSTYDCTGSGKGGSACNEFETSGSTYSGYGDGGVNSGKPNQTGIVIIKTR